jgi:DNA-directed RNA polymerase subunit F
VEIHDVARLCHEANREYCKLIGDPVAPRWDHSDQDRVIAGVEFVLAHPEATPKDVHDEWLRFMRSNGWSYGPTKDLLSKQHPAMTSFEQQPPAQRIKDRMFIALVNTMAPLFGYAGDRRQCVEIPLLKRAVVEQAECIRRLREENVRLQKVIDGSGNQLSLEREACIQHFEKFAKLEAENARLKELAESANDTKESRRLERVADQDICGDCEKIHKTLQEEREEKLDRLLDRADDMRNSLAEIDSDTLGLSLCRGLQSRNAHSEELISRIGILDRSNKALRDALSDAEKEIEETDEELLDSHVDLQKAEEALKRFEPGDDTLVQWQFGKRADAKWREAFEEHVDEFVGQNNRARAAQQADRAMKTTAENLAQAIDAEFTRLICNGSSRLSFNPLL